MLFFNFKEQYIHIQYLYVILVGIVLLQSAQVRYFVKITLTELNNVVLIMCFVCTRRFLIITVIMSC